MILETLTLPENPQSGNLYAAILRQMPQVPQRYIREAFDRRDVKLNNVRVRRDAVPIPNAVIAIYLSDDCPVHSPEIIYEDDNLMVINKPIGLSCDVDKEGGVTVDQWVYNAFAQRLRVPPKPCHRLDNPTDGLLILAKTEPALQVMELAFFKHQIHKRYTCLVKGEPSPREATLEAFLLKDARAAHVTVTQRKQFGALPIRTAYRVLELGEISRVEVTLYTGRTHQIRAHMAYLGYPLLGDDKYGDRDFNRLQHARRLMLTATELTFSLEGKFSYLNDLCLNIVPKF